MAKHRPKEYFLPPIVTDDGLLFRGSARAGRGLLSIVDGDAIFRELTEAILAANHSVLIAFWSIEASLLLISDAARKAQLPFLDDLLIDATKRGVLVRILISDFDPVFATLRHAAAWATYRRLVKKSADAGLSRAGFQVVCARHEAEIQPGIVTTRLILPRHDEIVRALNSMDDPRVVLNVSPGLWDKLKWIPKDKKVAVKETGKAFPIVPGSHHQKLLVVDGHLGFAGGINLIGANYDTQEHPPREALAWHDLFVRVEGSPVDDIVDNFIAIWNAERVRTDRFLRVANSQRVPMKMPVRATDDLHRTDIPAARSDVKKSTVLCQIQRTISRAGQSDVPDVARMDILEGYLRAIELAEDFIYLENQYFREDAIADAIIQRHRKRRQLRTVLVLPRVAEELMQGQADAVTQHGAALQHQAIERMATSIGVGLGVYTMLRPQDKSDIYVHSKVLIVDDVYGNVGSANANPRSFRMDTELNVAWYGRREVRTLRLKLWREVLGRQRGVTGWKPREYVRRWSKIAERNLRVGAKLRQGFVFPFVNDVEGLPIPFLPDELASLLPVTEDRVA